MTVAPRPAAASPAYDRADWASSFRNVSLELSDEAVVASRGEIPAELNGTLYRNGPGRLERDGHWVHHPFDGDGMITALRFEAAALSLTNRFVRTRAWQEEERAGSFLYRGVFGTQKPGGPLANAFDTRLKNIANTHVVPLGDQLLALWEASSPHALDPDSLETSGIALLDGVLKPGEPFSAHPHFDPGHHGEPRMVTFRVKSGPRSTVRLMEFATTGPKAGQLIKRAQRQFQGFAFLHDFAITPHWAVFLRNAMAFNPLPFALGLQGSGPVSGLPARRSRGVLADSPGGARRQQPRVLGTGGLRVPPSQRLGGSAPSWWWIRIVYDDFPSIGPGRISVKSISIRFPPAALQRCRIDPATGAVRSEVLRSAAANSPWSIPPAGAGGPLRLDGGDRARTGQRPPAGHEKLDLQTRRARGSGAPRPGAS